MPSSKADQFTLDSRDTVYGKLLSIAILLRNKIDYSFCAKVDGLCRSSYYIIAVIMQLYLQPRFPKCRNNVIKQLFPKSAIIKLTVITYSIMFSILFSILKTVFLKNYVATIV